MFTGIVEELGVVEAIEDQGDAVRLTVRGRTSPTDAALGDSISVNGCCLTVAERDGDDVHRRRDGARPSTRPRWAPWCPAARSTSSVRSPPAPGSAATSCRATSTASAPSYGGAVDALGRRRRSSLPAALSRYLVDKGSITVDGISLTVVAAGDRLASPSA